MLQDRVLMARGGSVGFLVLLLGTTVSGLGSVVWKLHSYQDYFYTWEKAQKFCKDYFMDLASVYTESEANSLHLLGYHAWIGLHKKGFLGDWVWADGVNYKLNAWADNEPHYTEDCAALNYNDQKVYGQDCSSYSFFFCHETEDGNRFYTFVPHSKTWEEAEEYCRSNGQHLAGLTNADVNMALKVQDFPVWTGTHKNGEIWKWTEGLSNYTNWKAGMPDDGGDCVSISSFRKEMATQNCNQRFPFVCVWENIILVKENKTWEEALEHCRGLSSTTGGARRHDLLSVQPGDEHKYVMGKVWQAGSEEVWTGLRFLAGEWVWVNGADMRYHLPLCPTLGHHCGAMLKRDTGSVEPRDCLERKNFLCYIVY